MRGMMTMLMLGAAAAGPAMAQPPLQVLGADALAAMRSALLASAATSANGSGVRVFTTTPTHLGEVVARLRTGEAEEHQLWTDEIVVREGEIELVTGGTMADRHPSGPPGEYRGSALVGGTSQRLHPGDVVEIPAGIYHWMKVLPGGPAVTLVYKVK